MKLPSPRWRAIVFVGVALCMALAGAWLLNARGDSPVQTDLLAMLPATERHPLAEAAVERLAHASGDRMVLVVEGKDDATVKQAARSLGQQLTASGTFSAVTAELPPVDLEEMLAPYLPHRFHLLAPQDRAALADPATDSTQMLARRLNEPFTAGVGVSLQDDPFGWLQHWLDRQPWGRTPLMPEDDLLTAHQGDVTSVMVLASLRGSSYDDQVQRQAMDALALAEHQLHRDFPNVSLLRTGAVFYAAQARAGAERDVHLVSIVSTVGIALLLLWAFRSPRPLLVAFVSTAFGVLCAATVTLAMFGQMHLLTLVFGAALLGEAVDYSIQYLCARANAGTSWRPLEGLRQVRPALLLALATSLLGYALLGALPFPALRQMACFAIVGMLGACASVFWLLPSLTAQPARHALSPSLVRLALTIQRGLTRVSTGKRGLLAVFVVLIMAAPGWWRLGHDDDIHLLVNTPASLQAQEARIRDITGIGQASQFYLVHGDDAEQVLQREEALAARLETMVAKGALASWTGISSMLPSLSRQQADHALQARWFDQPDHLRKVMQAAGMREAAIDAWMARWPGEPLTLKTWLAMPISMPYHYLWMGSSRDGTASIVLPQGQDDSQQLRDATKGLEGVELVDKPASVSALFGRYRQLASLWLGAALLLVGAVFAWRYRARAWRVLAPPAIGMALSLSALGYLGERLTLFHWMALMLVLGVGANYAVFLHEGEPHSRHRPGAAYAGVLLSALTAWLSFGLLALSSMPALQHFGITLLLGIGFTALLVPVAAPDGTHGTTA